jgi:hypothetical protein
VSVSSQSQPKTQPERSRPWIDPVVALLATGAWLVMGSGPREVEFDPPLLRAVLMGSAFLLGLPTFLDRPVRWDGWRGLLRGFAMLGASYTAIWIEMVLVAQWHAIEIESGNLAAAGAAIPPWEHMLELRLLAGLPWIASIVLGCRRGLIRSSIAPPEAAIPLESSPEEAPPAQAAEASPPASHPAPTAPPGTPDPPL